MNLICDGHWMTYISTRKIVQRWHIFTFISGPGLNLNIPVGTIFVSFVFSPLQQAAYHPEVGEELRSKALQYSSECTSGYINLLEQVLQVRMRHVS